MQNGARGYSFRVHHGTDASWLQHALRTTATDLVLLDIDACASASELVVQIKRSYKQIMVIVLSSCDTPHLITSFLSYGADDFLSHCGATAEVGSRLVHAWLCRHAPVTTPFPHAVGATMQTVAAKLARVLNSAITAVHVCGESGTGKEVVADIVRRIIAPQPLVTINCGGICPTLISSELFGHRKGAFTGAAHDRRGYVEQADGGWLFLDEVASLDSSTQSALLRALENHEVVRVGETKPRRVDVGILSASNVPIDNLVREGKFRLDLWQRLQEMEIRLPPLRERREEIPLLITHFLRTMRGGPWRIAPEAQRVLSACNWREGNARQLRNCLRTMSAHHHDGLLTPSAIPPRIWQQHHSVAHVENDDPRLSIKLRNTFRGRVNVTYEVLNNMLLLECVRENFRHRGRCGLREFATTFNIPPSTASRRLRALVDQCLIANDELATLIAVDIPRHRQS